MDKLILVVSTVFILPAVFTLSICVSLWWAWWLHPAWGWFVVPLGIPPINVWNFAGLLVLYKVCSTRTSSKKDTRETDWWSTILNPLLTPVFAWVVLWWLQ